MATREQNLSLLRAVMVSAALFAASSAYVAATIVPGGLNPETMATILRGDKAFAVFIILDGVTFLTSLISVTCCLSLIMFKCAVKAFRVKAAVSVFVISLMFMVLAYCVAVRLRYRHEDSWVPLFTYGITSLVILYMFGALRVIFVSSEF